MTASNTRVTAVEQLHERLATRGVEELQVDEDRWPVWWNRVHGIGETAAHNCLGVDERERIAVDDGR